MSAATSETGAKNLEMIREVLPSARRVAVLANANDPFHVPFLEHIQAGAGPLNIEIKPVMVRTAAELDTDFTDITAWRAEAVIVEASIPQQQRVAALALQSRIPAFALTPELTQLGGLLSYSADMEALYRRCAAFVDKILRGSKPADLPVEQPIKFWVAVNLRTAKVLGIAVPRTILERADEVIE